MSLQEVEGYPDSEPKVSIPIDIDELESRVNQLVIGTPRANELDVLITLADSRAVNLRRNAKDRRTAKHIHQQIKLHLLI
jgi:hypothetical protein